MAELKKVAVALAITLVLIGGMTLGVLQLPHELRCGEPNAPEFTSSTRCMPQREPPANPANYWTPTRPAGTFIGEPRRS